MILAAILLALPTLTPAALGTPTPVVTIGWTDGRSGKEHGHYWNGEFVSAAYVPVTLTPAATRTPVPGTPTRTKTRTATPLPFKSPTPTLTRTATATPSHTICNPPCDQYQVMYDFKGTFVPDVTAPWPPARSAFDFPANLRGAPRVYTLAYRAHNALGWGPVQLFPTDVTYPPPNPYADWIEQLSREGITAGCGPSIYCPWQPVTREQMSVFLLRIEHGADYVPPPCNGVPFVDVTCGRVTPAVTP